MMKCLIDVTDVYIYNTLIAGMEDDLYYEVCLFYININHILHLICVPTAIFLYNFILKCEQFPIIYLSILAEECVLQNKILKTGHFLTYTV